MNAEKEELIIKMVLTYAQLKYEIDKIQDDQKKALSLMEQEIFQAIKEDK